MAKIWTKFETGPGLTGAAKSPAINTRSRTWQLVFESKIATELTDRLKNLSVSVIIVDVTRGGAARLARVAHNHKVVGSNPTPATKKDFSKAGRSFLLPFTRGAASQILTRFRKQPLPPQNRIANEERDEQGIKKRVKTTRALN